MRNPVFYNQIRSGYEELFSYGPYFYKDILEMDANYQFAGYTLDTMAECLEQLMNDQFIEYADEETITRLESWLNIVTDPDRDLEDRRKKVKLMWNGGEKLSGRLIKNIVKSYTGCDETPEVKFTHMLSIKARVKEENVVYIGDLQELISRMKPAHIRSEISLVTPTDIVFMTIQKSYVFPFTLSGTVPDVATHGAYIASGMAIEDIDKSVVFSPDPSSEDMAVGTHPVISTIGQQTQNGLSISTEESLGVTGYAACGSSLCGEEVL